MTKRIQIMLAALIASVFMITTGALAAGSSVPQISTNKSVYNLGETMFLKVTDADSDPAAGTDATVTVTITSAGTSESTTKTLTNNNAGAAGADPYFGSVNGSPVAGAGHDDAAGGSVFGVTFSTSSYSSTPGGAGVNAVLQVTLPDTITLSVTTSDGDSTSITRELTYQDAAFTGSTSSILVAEADSSGAVGDDGTAHAFEAVDTATGGNLDAKNITVYINDQDANASTVAKDTTTVNVSSNFGAGSAVLTLQETGNNTGVFVGYVAAYYADTAGTFTSVTSGNGSQVTPTAAVVAVSSLGDTVTLKYPGTGSTAKGADGVSESVSHEVAVVLGTKGTIELDKTAYSGSEKIVITVTDADLDTTGGQDTIAIKTDNQTLEQGEVFLQTLTYQDKDEFVLTETGLKTGIFQVKIPIDINTDAADAGGNIGAVASDTFVASYYDANDGDTDTTNDTVSDNATFSTATGTVAVSPSMVADGAKLTITITDKDMNTSASSIQSFTAADLTTNLTITSDTGDSENGAANAITFTETGKDTGVFTGTITVDVTATEVANNGKVEAENNDAITITYTDNYDVSGAATSQSTATAIVGTTTAQVTFDKASYDVNDTVKVTLTDADRNTVSSSKQVYEHGGTIIAKVKSTTETTMQELRLVETDVDSGVFEGSFTLATASGQPGTSLQTLNVTPGDTLTVLYDDENDGAVETTDLSTTATVLAHTGTIELNKDEFNMNDTVVVTVVDTDLNTSATAINTYQHLVILKSSSDASGAADVTLTETDVDSGIFTGKFKTGNATVNATIPTIKVADGDGVSATYADAKNAAASTATAQVTGIANEKVAVITLDAESYALGSTLTISMDEIDKNTNASAVNTAEVNVKSDTDPVGITVVLVETDIDTGVFEKTISVKGTASVNGSSIQAVEGDTITVKYSDESNSDPVTARTIVTTTASVTAAADLAVSDAAPSIEAGKTTEITVSGGVSPYSVTTAPSAAIATASLSGSTLTITAVATGATDLVISDSAATAATLTVSITVVDALVLTATPADLTIQGIGETGSVTVANGTAPYTITISDDNIATVPADLAAAGAFDVTAVAVGTATITVTDADSATATVAVTVETAPVEEPVVFPTEEPAIDTPTTPEEIADAAVNMGGVASGADTTMQLGINVPAYVDADGNAKAMDIYVAIMLPDGSLFLVDADGNLTVDFVAAATNTSEALELSIFDSFETCGPFGAMVPEGTWYAFWVVLETGTDFNAVDWTNDAYVMGFYSFDVSCD